MPRTYKLEAFIIKRRDYRDADKILTIFSKQKGKQTVIAKGIRKLTSRRAGSLELFNQVHMMVADGRGQLSVVADTVLMAMYPAFASQYYKLYIAYQLVELIDRLTVEEQTHTDIFDLLIRAFDYLNNAELAGDLAERILIRFKCRILEMLGFGVPAQPTLHALRAHIEEITERKLVAYESFRC